ncbi:sensor histidine kinase [Buchananella hordeovulneris]|uniref:sensor histidine kinase n=1 Tax=Buchananella hordeovulneris TaxID=52770 RepID=UPI0026DAAAF8|nr:sensor histidine kinase [Buchananella hordeovulneris]MDO5080098.1 sensor histidine kinase [Buchananella hordeovulneris]
MIGLTQARDGKAPGFVPGAVGLPWWRRCFAQGGAYVVPSLLFLIIPVVQVQDRPWSEVLVAYAVLFTVAVSYVGVTLVLHWPTWARVAWFCFLLFSLTLPSLVTGKPHVSVYYSVYATTAAAMLFAVQWAVPVIMSISCLGFCIATFCAGQDMLATSMSLMSAMAGLMAAFGIRSDLANEALKDAEGRTAVLAVAAERERIGRDLHDILGHSLTAIAVQADLASRLLERKPAAARTEIESLGRTARQALADVRSTVSGMKTVRLASEIAAVKALLLAAGIEAHTPSVTTELTDSESELLGYVVREAVTNVVRHSRARTCTITVTPRGVTIADDGTGGKITPGNGLRGLKKRLDAMGGSLTIQTDGAGTTICADLGETAS